MVNSAIINWYLKKQNVVETSIFGAELIALRTALEMTEAFVYKSIVLGVKVDDAPVILCDDSSVVINTSYPVSLLKKSIFPLHIIGFVRQWQWEAYWCILRRRSQLFG